MSFGENLRQARRIAGLPQDELAAALDVSRQAVSKWEMDQTCPDVNNLIKLCGLLHVSADELLGTGTGPAPAEGAGGPAAPVPAPDSGALKGAAQLNFMKRVFTMGCVLAAAGAVLAVAGLTGLGISFRKRKNKPNA